ncbi:MAG: hypothetical protein ACLRH0_11865 [Blautia wexlerae]
MVFCCDIFEDIPQYVREIIHLYPDRPNEISYLGDSADYGENSSWMMYIITWRTKCCGSCPVSG